MPPVVVAVVVAAASYAALGVTLATALTLASLAYSLTSSLTAKKPKTPSSPGLDFTANARLVTARQPVAPWQVVVGQTRVGGIYAFVHSSNNQTQLHLVIVLACHEVEEIGAIYFDDELLSLDESNGLQSVSATGKYAGSAYFAKHLGAPDQTVDTGLISVAPGIWTADHRLRGRAYLRASLIWNPSLYPNGVPNITAVVKGMKVYDPRTAETRWTNNASLLRAGYICNASFGLGAVYANEIDEETLIAAANIDDEAVPRALLTMNFSAQLAGAPATAPSPAGAGAGNLNDGLYTYKVTFVRAAQETAGSAASVAVAGVASVGSGGSEETFTPVNQQYNVTIPLGPGGTTARRLYRTAANGSTHRLLATIADNTSTVFNDNFSDASLGAAIPESGTLVTGFIVLDGTKWLRLGDIVRLSTESALPGGLLTATDYYWSPNGQTPFCGQFAATLATARLGHGTAVTSIGSGRHTITQTGEPRYTCNGTFTVDKPPREIVAEMNSANLGKTVYVGFVFQFFSGAYYPPTRTALTQDDLRKGYDVATLVPLDQSFNGVKGIYIAPEKRWQPDDFPPVKSDSYMAADGGERVWSDIKLPYTDSPSMAQRIAKIVLLRNRQELTTFWRCKLSVADVAIGEVVPLTEPGLGWNSKPFEPEEFTLATEEDKYGNPYFGIDLALRETAPEIYDWQSSEEQLVDIAPNSNFPNPFLVGAPSNPRLSSGSDHLLELAEGSVISRILFEWDGVPNAFVTDYEVQFRKVDDSEWAPSGRTRGLTRMYLAPVQDGTAYVAQVRAVNRIVSGDWLISESHIVLGKSEKPPRPGDFTCVRLADGTRRFAWTLDPLPADVRSGGGFKIRYAAGVVTDWAAMTDLHSSGLLRNSPYESNDLAAGTYTFAIKTVDSSGNESLDGRFIQVELGDPRLRTVLLQRLEHDLDWPGTLTDCFRFQKRLLALSAQTIADLPTTIAALPATIGTIVTNRSPIRYRTPVIDIESEVAFTPLLSPVGSGTITTSFRTGSAADGTAVGSFVALVPVSGQRYVQFEMEIAGADPRLEQLTILLDGETKIDEFEDVNTLTETEAWFERIGTGQFRIGSKSGQIAAITSAVIRALQNVGPGWSWDLVTKAATVDGQPAAEFRVFDDSGALADAVIDVELKGAKRT